MSDKIFYPAMGFVISLACLVFGVAWPEDGPVRALAIWYLMLSFSCGSIVIFLWMAQKFLRRKLTWFNPDFNFVLYCVGSVLFIIVLTITGSVIKF